MRFSIGTAVQHPQDTVKTSVRKSFRFSSTSAITQTATFLLSVVKPPASIIKSDGMSR